MRTNREFHKSICGSATTFYLADLHVHTPASADVLTGERLAAISPDYRDSLEGIVRLGLSPEEFERKVVEAYPPAQFLEDIARTRDLVAEENGIGEGYDWAVLGLTDHNVCAYSCEVAQLAWSERSRKRIFVLPGIELDVRYSIDDESEAIAHVLCLFRPGSRESDLRIAVHDAVGGGWEPGAGIVTESLPSFVHALRSHERYPAICIAAHVATERGVQGGTRNAILSRLNAEITRVQQEIEHGEDPDRVVLKARLEGLQSERTADDEISLSCLELIGDCGFDALQIASQEDEVHYRYLHRYKPNFGRAVPVIASDAHSPNDIFRCDGGTPFLKLSSASSNVGEMEVFDEVRNALRLGETRFSFRTPSTVQYWISGVEVSPDSSDAARFWPYSEISGEDDSFTLPLSRNLNAFVGGRGAGKSAAIEALSFVSKSAEYDSLDLTGPPDWYRRARATLAGCNLRLCFQFLGGDRASDLQKKALFARRHFPTSGEFESVHFSDLNDRELLPNQIPSLSVHVFRLGEIELQAGPDRLRTLFDAICGPEVRELEEAIRQKMDELAEQRQEMVGLAEEIAQLTLPEAPLRDYMRRQELLAEVNRPEVREAFERIDALETAQRVAASAKQTWDDLRDAISPDESIGAIRDYFTKQRSSAIADDGSVLLHLQPLLEIFGRDSEEAEGEGGRLRNIVQAAGAFDVQLKSMADDLSTCLKEVEAASREARDAMQQQGLPSGGKDREAKKRSLEEAKETLVLYRDLIARWSAAETTRNGLVEDLRGLADRRSNLREETATVITEKLKRDLDSDILVIKANARTQSDTGLFRNWLDRHFSGQTFKYRDKRVSALLDRGLSPGSLRELLTDISPENLVLLETPGSASEGGIESGVARTLYAKCVALIRLSPEKQEGEVDGELWGECPEEVRDGLLEFQRDANGDLCLDSVLELDEILFDDEPVIMLNDRPQDSGATLRPLEDLSPGQRCSAILPILLLTGEGPLIIDQPEDNLDNRLIRQVIVNILASIKLRRQVIVATHNPNVPVLGDVENAVVLRGVRDRECVVDVAGGLDDGDVVHHLTQVMEGGREAFQYRQTIYQLHWAEAVAENEIGETSE